MKTNLTLVAFVATLLSNALAQEAKPETLRTRIGELTFTHDFANGAAFSNPNLLTSA